MVYNTNIRSTLGLAVAAGSSGVAAWCLVGAFVSAPTAAGPVVCTTTLEAPISSGQAPQGGAVGLAEVTRCGVVQTTPQLMEQHFYSYTAPFARGVSLTNQITDLFGIAMGGGDGTRVMGFGFPDQTIIWDGTAVENTYQVLLQQQSDPMPWRTEDGSNGYSGSLGSAGSVTQSSYRSPVRGPW